MPAPPEVPATAAASPPGEPTSRLGALPPATGTQAPARPELLTVERPVQPTWAVPGAAAALALPMPALAAPAIAERTLPAPSIASAAALTRIEPLARAQGIELAQLDASAQEARRQLEQLQATSADPARRAAERELVAQATPATPATPTTLPTPATAPTSPTPATAATPATPAKPADADAARREASRRAMGRQLDEEATRRREAEAAAAAIKLPPGADTASARQPAPLPLSWSSARRGRLLGRSDANAELVRYAEAFGRKIELNMTMAQVREAARERHTNPLVTVAIRQDGSVESVNFVVSSGVPAIDEAIRRIVQSQAPYPAFAPALASDFDVIEIRRTWSFDMAVRLY